MRDGMEKRYAEELCKVADERFKYMYALRTVLISAEISEMELALQFEKVLLP